MSLLSGHSHAQIAEILTRELEGRESISQRAVSRWLKSVGDEAGKAAGPVIDGFIKINTATNLEKLQTFIDKNYAMATGQLDGIVVNGEAIRTTAKERWQAEQSCCNQLKIYFSLIGPGGGGDEDEVLTDEDDYEELLEISRTLAQRKMERAREGDTEQAQES